MTAFRFFLILVIFVLACTAWWALGGTVYWRTGSLKDQLSEDVDSLWGPANLSQPAPYLGANAERAAPVDPLASSIKVHLEHENRYKGLLWFSTYTVDFAGTYTLKADARANVFVFALPAGVPFTDNLARIFHECYAAARHGVRWAERVAAEAEIPAWARNTPLPP